MKTLAPMRWMVPAAVSVAVLGCAATPTPEEAAQAAAAAEEAERQARFDSQMEPFRAWERKFELASDRGDRPERAGRGTDARTGICAEREAASSASISPRSTQSTKRRAASGCGALFRMQTVLGISSVPCLSLSGYTAATGQPSRRATSKSSVSVQPNAASPLRTRRAASRAPPPMRLRRLHRRRRLTASGEYAASRRPLWH